MHVSMQFSDMLIYTSRIAASSLQFKVHGQLSLKGMSVSAPSFCFILGCVYSFYLCIDYAIFMCAFDSLCFNALITLTNLFTIVIALLCRACRPTFINC